MRLFSRRPRPGTVWDGPAAIYDDASVDHRHGAYALTDDGKQLRKPVVRLVTVVAADGEHHYEIAGRGDGPVRHHPDFVHRTGDTIELDPEAIEGDGSVLA